MPYDYKTRYDNAIRFMKEVDRAVKDYSWQFCVSERRLREDLNDPSIKGVNRSYDANIYQLRLRILSQSYGTLVVGKDKDIDQLVNQDIMQCSSYRIKEVFCKKMKYSQNILDDFGMAKEYAEGILNYDGIVRVINANSYDCDMFNEVVYKEPKDKVESSIRHDLTMLMESYEPEWRSFLEQRFGEIFENWDKYYKPQ